MTTSPTQGEHAQTEALPTITRYKIGYPTDSWGERSSTPGGIPDFAGTWVRYADHAAELRRLHAQVAALTAQPDAPPCIEAVINPHVAATALRAYIKDCEAHAIVPDVGGAWHAAFLAGAASRTQPQAGVSRAADELARDLKHAIDTATELRQQLRLMEESARGEIWRWQADGVDNLATMGNRMGVLIYASDLRNLIASASTTAQGAESMSEGFVAVPVEVANLYDFMHTAFVPMTPQQEQIEISLELARKACGGKFIAAAAQRVGPI